MTPENRWWPQEGLEYSSLMLCNLLIFRVRF
nr:MAG TPA: hypothetical protein [Caudoviricetes sp.]DAO77861.1 MAG TPA: hypothetical protein [Bacteriophage sp.]DAO98189.1 MAG TPA: hypothetical protein [Caudoviricetes sp.]DAP77881.1 MAG TPA: hypothetical protein [Caudoviricetes sp.]